MKKFNFSSQDHIFIIAELSANHNGSLDTAIETIRAAKRAGADAIKLQTYTADTLTIDSKKSDFIINNGSIWDGKNFYELYQEAYTPWEWHARLFEVANSSELSSIMIELMNNPELAREYGENFRTKVINEFSDTVMAQRHVDIYEKIVSTN